MFSFSTCWNSKRHTDGREMLAEVRSLGFDYAELGHATRLTLVDGIQAAVKAGELKISSVHNFCPLPVGVNGPAPDHYLPSSRREDERALAIRHTIRSIDFAASLEAKAVVMHLGLVDMRNFTMRLVDMHAQGLAGTPKYVRVLEKALRIRAKKSQKYFDQVLRTLDMVVPHAREAGVKLGIETRFGIEEIPNEDETEQIISRYGHDVCQYWHDVGHAQIKEMLGLLNHESILERFRGRTAGMHLQDFAPPAFDHLPPGHGGFNFSRLRKFLTPDMVLAWEIHPEWPAEEMVERFKVAHATLSNPVTS
jgi:sugar phosphate isomerase/epimerase